MSFIVDGTACVGDLAAQIPGAARVLEDCGIDFCCAGRRSLRAACEDKGVDLGGVLAALEQGALEQGFDSPQASGGAWLTAALPSLMAHIVSTHHRYVRAETPRIQRWLDKVVAAHGERRPEVIRIRHHFAAMVSEMSQHMAKEELFLFPAIARLAGAPPSPDVRPDAAECDSLAQPVQSMMLEHDHAGRDLAEIREASGGYTPPPAACATFRALYQALAEFESDLRQHVHLENNILFPRALALEARG